MKRSVEKIRSTLQAVFKASGASGDEAALFADVLVEAELRGRPTHGLNRVGSILGFLKDRPVGTPRVVVRRGPMVRIDGGDQSGYLVAAFAADVAASTAAEQGHALVGVRNTRHSGMLGYYADRIVRRDLVALVCANCSPMVAPWGAAEAVMGTNPIAAAFPASPHPILIDMGTAAITYGALDYARRTGQAVPEGCIINSEGQPTTDPNDVGTILPFGRHRGSALSLMVQLLSSAVVGAAGIPENHTDYGIFMLAMKPDLFAPRDSYDDAVRQIVNRVRSAKPRSPGIQVLVPGERAYREREKRLNEGIDVADSQWQELTGLLRNPSEK